MFDLWRPKDAIDGRYAWLPVEFRDNQLEIVWRDTFWYQGTEHHVVSGTPQPARFDV